jgi:hypothetical protein
VSPSGGPSPSPAPPRLAPGRSFPPYAYFGAPDPHPLHHPRGHSYRLPPRKLEPLDPDRWRESEEYLFGFDLFNHGYYWEAHDAWEGLWVAAGKRGAVSEHLKGLIKLTAAGVKVRQGITEGVRRHAQAAQGHFLEARRLGAGERFAGLSLSALEGFARKVEEGAATWPCPPRGPAFVFDRYLIPGD